MIFHKAYYLIAPGEIPGRVEEHIHVRAEHGGVIINLYNAIFFITGARVSTIIITVPSEGIHTEFLKTFEFFFFEIPTNLLKLKS